MIKLSFEFAQQIMDSRNAQGKCEFGYICEHGALVGESEFSVYEEDGRKFSLVHKSELEEQGPFIRVKGQA